MDKRLIIICGVAGVFLLFYSFPDGILSLILLLLLSLIFILIRRNTEEKYFLTNVFIIALLLRLVLGVAIDIFDLRGVFGPDSYYYNNIGRRMADMWLGYPVPGDMFTYIANNPSGSGWGMFYLVGAIYYVFGSSFLVAQTFCAFFGALTVPLIYFCANEIFNNKRVAKLSAISIAVFPSFVVWSSQLLKDGLLIFLLVAVMLVLLQLQKKVSIQAVLVLLIALFGIYTLRFYLFYMVAAAVVGSFFVSAASSAKTVVRNLVIVSVLGLALTYLGVIQGAGANFETYGNLERLQISRDDLATSADSGFGEDIDVSTPAGVLAAVPIGLLYLYFAPFPWQIEKFSQIMVLPETFLWWLLIPLMVSGLKYTLKNKFRPALPILLFSLMLTLLYSVFQGNVGMLYRQRTQIQVFLFMFVAAGWTLFLERRENAAYLHRLQNEQKIKRLRELKERNQEV